MFVPDLGAVGAEVELSPDESYYVARVCRARAGETLEATDGAGRLAVLRVREIGPEVRAAVESVAARPRAARAWVITGMPEGTRADWMVEKLAELGVERWLPVDVARARWPESYGRHARWERIALAAMKQSRSVHRMEIASPAPLAAMLDALPPGPRVLASADGEALRPSPAAPFTVAAIGPSPGFAPEELELLHRTGFTSVALATHRLRAETAAIAWASVWAAGAAALRP